MPVFWMVVMLCTFKTLRALLLCCPSFENLAYVLVFEQLHWDLDENTYEPQSVKTGLNDILDFLCN